MVKEFIDVCASLNNLLYINHNLYAYDEAELICVYGIENKISVVVYV